jgi:hypothetical protein
MSATITVTPAEAARLSDQQLVDTVHELAPRIVDTVPDADWLYVLFTEAFERWAPEAEWANLTRRHLAEEPTRERALFEIAGAREGMRSRAAARLEARLARGGAQSLSEGGTDG